MAASSSTKNVPTKASVKKNSKPTDDLNDSQLIVEKRKRTRDELEQRESRELTKQLSSVNSTLKRIESKSPQKKKPAKCDDDDDYE